MQRRSRKRIVLPAVTAGVLVGLTPRHGIGSTDATRVTAVSAAKAAKPRNIKTLSAKQTADGADIYLRVRAGKRTVGAKWIGNVKGSWYSILIADSGSSDKRRCRRHDVHQIIRARTGTLVSQKVVCLIGVA